MSIVSSAFSTTRLSGWRVNVRFSSLMESIYSIAFGLGLRFVVDTVGHHDLKLTAIIVGLWEGIILLHFIKKMPKSSDPYIAYGVRHFVDFLYTESVARFVLITVCTALGMVLADVVPPIWDNVGLKRIWRHFRRDLYTITRMIPTVAFFPPTRTVRFSPSREPSVISEAPSDISASIITPSQAPATNLLPPPSAIREILRRRVPGHFRTDFSDTETDPGSMRGRSPSPSILGTTHSRLAVPKRRNSIDAATDISSTLSQNDVDDGNLSSSVSSSSTEIADISVDREDLPDIGDEQEEEAAAVAEAAVKDEDLELTPKQKFMYMPPTPSDTVPPLDFTRERDEPLTARPHSPSLPQIPDFLEEPSSEEWEKIQHAEAIEEEEQPPTPPEKDRFFVSRPNTEFRPSTVKAPTPPPQEALTDWAGMDSQVLERPENDSVAQASTTHDSTHRSSLPPPYTNYVDDPDDIYYDGPDNGPATTTNETHDPEIIVSVPELGTKAYEIAHGDSEGYWNFNPVTAADIEAERIRVEQQRQAEEAATAAEAQIIAEAQQRVEEEAAAAEAQRLANEAKAERERQEAEAAAERELEEAAKRKLMEEEEAERKRAEEEWLKLEEEQKQKAEADKQERKKKEQEDEDARKRKREEDEEKRRKKEEEAKKLREEEEAEKRRKKQAEDAEKQKKKEEREARKKEKAEEAERKRQEDEKKLRQEAEREQQQQQKEEEERQKQEVIEKAKKEEQEKQRNEEEKKRLEQDAAKKDEEVREAARFATAEELALEKKKDDEANEQRPEDVKEAEEQMENAGQKSQEAGAREKVATAQAAPDAEAAENTKGTQKAEEERATTEEEERKQALEGQDQLAAQRSDADDDFFAQHRADTARREIANQLQDEQNDQDLQERHDSTSQEDLNEHADTAENQGDAEPAAGSSFDEKSEISALSETGSTVGERLRKLLLLRAQMVAMEERLKALSADEDLTPDKEQEIKHSEKILGRMQKKETRRREEVSAHHPPNYLNIKQGIPDSVTLSADMPPGNAETLIEEELEQIMAPGASTVRFAINIPKPKGGVRPKHNVTEVLERYQLFPYVVEETSNRRIVKHINIPEKDFAAWLTAYRVKETQLSDDHNRI